MVLRGDEARYVYAGSTRFVGETFCLVPPDDGLTSIDVGWDHRVRGRIHVSDSLRDGVAGDIAEIRSLGVATVLLSGDRYAVAEETARKCGIESSEAPRTPVQKRDSILSAVSSGKVVAMVGDGINDAPPLAAAHVGIAMGTGMDLAKEAGNVIVLCNRLKSIPWLIRLSRRSERIVRENLAWSFGYNLVALSAAAAGLLHPLISASAMVASGVTVMLNSLRIRSFAGIDEEAGQAE
jgi:P-type E1-E2 ATPase